MPGTKAFPVDGRSSQVTALSVIDVSADTVSPDAPFLSVDNLK